MSVDKKSTDFSLTFADFSFLLRMTRMHAFETVITKLLKKLCAVLLSMRLHLFPLSYTMVYTSPSKVSQIVELKNISQSDYEIAHQFNLHCTTIPCIIKQFSESGHPYFQKLNPGHPHKLQECNAHHGAILLATTEAANVTELTKKAFPHVSRITVSWVLHQYRLVSCVP
jgi:transposase